MTAFRLTLGIGAAVVALALVKPAAAQNPTGMLTPFPPSMPIAPMPISPGLGGGNGPGHGGPGHHPGPIYPPFVYFPYGGLMNDSSLNYVPAQPLNPEPFAPATPPAYGQRESTKPYKAPSVETAPGGIEIVRGPGG